MDAQFSIVVYILDGFFGLLLLLFVQVMLFGKRIRNKGEFDIEMTGGTG